METNTFNEYIESTTDYLTSGDAKSDFEYIINVLNKKLVPRYKSGLILTEGNCTTLSGVHDQCYFSVGEFEIDDGGHILIEGDTINDSDFWVEFPYECYSIPFPLGAIKDAAKFLRDNDTFEVYIGTEKVIL